MRLNCIQKLVRKKCQVILTTSLLRKNPFTFAKARMNGFCVNENDIQKTMPLHAGMQPSTMAFPHTGSNISYLLPSPRTPMKELLQFFDHSGALPVVIRALLYLSVAIYAQIMQGIHIKSTDRPRVTTASRTLSTIMITPPLTVA